MKLAYSIATCSEIFNANPTGFRHDVIASVCFDTRRINHSQGVVFFALDGAVRSGENFVNEAYSKGIRFFVLPSSSVFSGTSDCVVWKVDSPLIALQSLAAFHRKQFSYPVLAITGSVGKTTFKEWAFHCLSPYFNIVRSPKSYNSQLGVALSLLEMHADANLAIIEAGISMPGEMDTLAKMIQPDLGVFTAFGKAHTENFSDAESHLNEKLRLFENTKLTFLSSQFESLMGQLVPSNFQICGTLRDERFPVGYAGMLGVLSSLVSYLGIAPTDFQTALITLPVLALRMEQFEGVNGNWIINDTYNLDADALQEALHYQQQVANNRKRIVVLGLDSDTTENTEVFQDIIAPFQPDEVHFIPKGGHIPWNELSDSVVLVKAHRLRAFEQEVARGKALKHRTVVEINLSTIKHNIAYYRSRLPKDVKVLCMVKADAYGAGAIRISRFLELNQVDYLGVAFADEGVALRKAGISLPIVVMNPDPEHASIIIQHQLEPAVYSFGQLDAFIKELILNGNTDYPVHLKFDTGMHRLGFQPSDKEKIHAILSAQPEVRIQGIYSHLADADNQQHSTFTTHQIHVFEEIISFFRAKVHQPFIAHLLNSEGALRYSKHAFDMVRIGISMYGYTENEMLRQHLLSSVKWRSAISQVKSVSKGDFIGYGCSYEAKETMTIAIVPVGYADGFRRSLSNGIGAVIIGEKRCEIVGRVCMDMIMVNVTGLQVHENEPVEIIGETQTMETFANSLQTIPYEVMTSLSKRMERVYVES